MLFSPLLALGLQVLDDDSPDDPRNRPILVQGQLRQPAERLFRNTSADRRRVMPRRSFLLFHGRHYTLKKELTSTTQGIKCFPGIPGKQTAEKEAAGAVRWLFEI